MEIDGAELTQGKKTCYIGWWTDMLWPSESVHLIRIDIIQVFINS